MIQVAAYCRVSTDKEDQANSFETQQRYFREWIDRNPGYRSGMRSVHSCG